MSGLLTIRDAFRDFLRKYDEVTTPLIHFVLAYIMFSSINSAFGYSDFLAKGAVVLLLSIICALVSSSVVVLLGGLIVTIHCFSVSVDIGILCVLLFICIYCAYMRMFKDSSFALALVPILMMWKITYAAPVIIAIFAGFAGAVPAAIGVALFYFAQYVGEARVEILADTDPEFQGYAYVIDHLVKNKEMFLLMIVFALVVMITALIYKFSFDYAWYVAIAVGAISTVLFFLVCGMALNVDVALGGVFGGAVLGGIIATLVQMCKSVADYAHKESVQFEDDDYYYYVKAIPKFNNGKKEKTSKNVAANVNAQMQNRPQGSGQQRMQQGQRPQGNGQQRMQQDQRPQGNGQNRPQQGQRPQGGGQQRPQQGQRPQGKKY